MLCPDIDGLSLHAAVRCAADDRDALEQLCRTITRPALADERVQLNAAGQVELKLITPWRDGTTHLVMSPLEFMQRLARAFTGRDKIVKFEGGYHGMSAEAQMSLAPARQLEFAQALPDSAGIPEAVRAQMLNAPFNDLDYLETLLSGQGGEVAGLIVEPLQRFVPPAPGFLAGVRALCDKP